MKNVFSILALGLCVWSSAQAQVVGHCRIISWDMIDRAPDDPYILEHSWEFPERVGCLSLGHLLCEILRWEFGYQTGVNKLNMLDPAEASAWRPIALFNSRFATTLEYQCVGNGKSPKWKPIPFLPLVWDPLPDERPAPANNFRPVPQPPVVFVLPIPGYVPIVVPPGSPAYPFAAEIMRILSSDAVAMGVKISIAAVLAVGGTAAALSLLSSVVDGPAGVAGAVGTLAAAGALIIWICDFNDIVVDKSALRPDRFIGRVDIEHDHPGPSRVWVFPEEKDSKEVRLSFQASDGQLKQVRSLRDCRRVEGQKITPCS